MKELKFLFQDLVARASLEQRKLHVTRMRTGETKCEQLSIVTTLNLNNIPVNRAAELLVGLTLGTHRPNKTARKIWTGVTRNLEVKVKRQCCNALYDDYHIYILMFMSCICNKITLKCQENVM